MPSGHYPRKPLTEETKRKIGLANSISLKGRKLSEDHRRKVILAITGRKHPPRSEDWLRKQRLAKCGVKHSPTTDLTKQKIREALLKSGHRPPVYKGKDCHFWKGGITPINEAIRASNEYKLWRKSVFERDKWTCVLCGTIGCRKNPIQADHIKSFAHYPDLRVELSNGRTLCVPCHRKTDTWGNSNKI
jgi:5-methylcytosine-specific restriction endonuclease McrA